jgi:drug/metabolite transporter (DMT)-like permease
LNLIDSKNKLIPLALVVSTVILQITAALVLDYAASLQTEINKHIILLLFSVFCIQGVRFIIWGIIHKKFKLSKTYPVIAVFFPLIYLLSIIKGETILSPFKILGIIIIISGIILVNHE